MTVKERQEVITELFNEVSEVLFNKGQAYAVNNDCFSTFKVGEKYGTTKYQTWGAFFEKHVASIQVAIKENPQFPVEKTESMKGRIQDAIAYLGILHAMLVNDELEKKI